MREPGLCAACRATAAAADSLLAEKNPADALNLIQTALLRDESAYVRAAFGPSLRDVLPLRGRAKSSGATCPSGKSA